jgi:hypothetical protein
MIVDAGFCLPNNPYNNNPATTNMIIINTTSIDHEIKQALIKENKIIKKPPRYQ